GAGEAVHYSLLDRIRDKRENDGRFDASFFERASGGRGQGNCDIRSLLSNLLYQLFETVCITLAAQEQHDACPVVISQAAKRAIETVYRGSVWIPAVQDCDPPLLSPERWSCDA